MIIYFKLAFRNIFRHKLRSLVTLASIVLCCTAVIFVGGFFNDIYFKVRENGILSYTGHLQILRKGFSEKGSLAPFDFLIEDSPDILSRWDPLNKLEASIRRDLIFAGFLSNGEANVACMVFGVQTDDGIHEGIPPSQRLSIPSSSGLPVNQKSQTERAGGVMSAQRLDLGILMVEGADISSNYPRRVSLGVGLSRALGVKVGDSLILLSRTAQGSINGLDVTVGGIFSSGIKEQDDYGLRLLLATAQNLIRFNGVKSFVVTLSNTDHTQAAKRIVEEVIARDRLDLEVKTWDELNDFYTKTKIMFDRWFLILKILFMVIMILIIFNTMNMVVMERTTEIGTVMALGTKRRGVVRLFLMEGFLIGVLGGIMGVLGGVILTQVAHHIGIPMPVAPGFSVAWISEPRLVAGDIFFSFMLSVFTATAAAVWPAYRSASAEIAQSLRYVS